MQGSTEALQGTLTRYFVGFFIVSVFGHSLFHKWTLPGKIKRRVVAKAVAQYIKDDIRAER